MSRLAQPTRRPEEAHWTGFVFLVVPLAGLSGDPDDLARRVEERIGRDVVMADTVTVGLCPAVDGDRPESGVVLRALHRTAFAMGYMFAPSVVFGCVVVDDDEERAAQAAARLSRAPALRSLPVHYHGVGTGHSAPGDEEESPPNAPVGAQAVSDVVAKLSLTIEAFERWPHLVISEADLIGQQRRLVARNAMLTAPEGDTTAATEPAPRAVEQPRRTRWATPFPLRRKPPAPKYGDALERIARSSRSVALLYLVFVADRERIDRGAHRRRSEIARQLDDRIAAMPREQPEAGLVPVEVGMFTAAQRLTRSGPLQPAGQLAKARLPKPPQDYFDLVESVRGLLEAREREEAALERRDIEVAETHVVFLSTSVPLADTESVDKLVELRAVAEVAWVFIGVDRSLVSQQFEEAGVTVLVEHPDVVAELIDQTLVGARDAGRSAGG